MVAAKLASTFLLLAGLGEPVFPQGGGTVLDLTYPFNNETIYWPKHQKFELRVDFKGMTSGGFWMATHTLTTSEHGGTHLDAPSHFSVTGRTVDMIPAGDLISEGIVLSTKDEDRASPDAELRVADIARWEAAHGKIRSGVIVLVRTGWGRFWGNKSAYLGSSADSAHDLRFPGVSYEAAKALVQRSVRAVGIDTASLDPGRSRDFLVHQALAAADIYGIENVANMHLLPETGFRLVVAPMKIEGGSGGPCRVLAIMDGDLLQPSSGVRLVLLARPFSATQSSLLLPLPLLPYGVQWIAWRSLTP